jgi:hypothetical protein
LHILPVKQKAEIKMKTEARRRMSDTQKLALSAIAGAVVAASVSYFAMSKPNAAAAEPVTQTIQVETTSASLDVMEKKGPYLEYSVVYTDRAFNLMSPPFQQTMKELSSSLKKAYNAKSVAIIPGSGTYGMEAVAMQFAAGKKVMVLRNGYFSFRWSDIFAVTKAVDSEVILKARPVADQLQESQPQFAPPPIAEVIAAIMRERPAVVFAPHVETSTGILLDENYIVMMATAVHGAGGIFCAGWYCGWYRLVQHGAAFR